MNKRVKPTTEDVVRHFKGQWPKEEPAGKSWVLVCIRVARGCKGIRVGDFRLVYPGFRDYSELHWDYICSRSDFDEANKKFNRSTK